MRKRIWAGAKSVSRGPAGRGTSVSTAKDAYGNVTSGYLGTVHFTSKTTFLENLFHDVLGRDIDASGMSWFLELMAEGMTPNQIALLILSGGEYQADVIQADFQKFLARDADAGAIAAFSREMSDGMTDQQLIVGIAGQGSGSEYYDRVTA